MILDALKSKSDAFGLDTLRAALVEDIFRHLEVIAATGIQTWSHQARESQGIRGPVLRGCSSRELSKQHDSALDRREGFALGLPLLSA